MDKKNKKPKEPKEEKKFKEEKELKEDDLKKVSGGSRRSRSDECYQ